MPRLCSIWIPIKEQKAEPAMRRVLKLTSLEPKPKAVRVLSLTADQKELCIEFSLPCAKTDHEAEETMKKIWSDHIENVLKEFVDQGIEITI